MQIPVFLYLKQKNILISVDGYHDFTYDKRNERRRWVR
jgi:hypothetical protein